MYIPNFGRRAVCLWFFSKQSFSAGASLHLGIEFRYPKEIGNDSKKKSVR